jgi:hypothetical protein
METHRDHKRIMIMENVDAAIAMGGVETKATIIDLSTNGARIAYTGAPLKPNTTIGIVSGGLSLHRQSEVMWSKPLDDNVSLAGLRFSQIG